jgi:hypothetical protein
VRAKEAEFRSAALESEEGEPHPLPLLKQGRCPVAAACESSFCPNLHPCDECGVNEPWKSQAEFGIAGPGQRNCVCLLHVNLSHSDAEMDSKRHRQPSRRELERQATEFQEFPTDWLVEDPGDGVQCQSSACRSIKCKLLHRCKTCPRGADWFSMERFGFAQRSQRRYLTCIICRERESSGKDKLQHAK